MRMGLLAKDGCKSRVVMRLYVLAAWLCVGLLMPQAHAHMHPAPIRAAHERRGLQAVPAKREKTHARHVAQAEPEHKAARRGRPEKSHGKNSLRSSAHEKPKAPTRTKHRRLRPEEEADNDPLPLHRVRVPASAASSKAVPKRVAEVVPVPARPVVSANEFVRAAGGDAAPVTRPALPAQPAEIFETGESHPDDDERLPITRAQAPAAMAVVSAAPPGPPTPLKATVPEKLEALVAKAGGAMRADAASTKTALTKTAASRPPAMPVDKAAKDEVIEAAMTPMVLPVMYKRNGHLIVPPPMRGTHDILVHQNLMADSAGLDRIQDDDDLDRMRMQRLLVALPASRSLAVNEDLPLNRRYARPWTARFAADVAKNFYAQFHQPLRLNSAVRTVEYQRRLQRVNGNAAGTDGEDASPHLTGQAIDLGKRGMSTMQIAWMRAYLLPLMQAGKIDVEEEFLQSCFHISVYPAYLPAARKSAPKTEVAKVAPLRQPVGRDEE